MRNEMRSGEASVRGATSLIRGALNYPLPSNRRANCPSSFLGVESYLSMCCRAELSGLHCEGDIPLNFGAVRSLSFASGYMYEAYLSQPTQGCIQMHQHFGYLS